MVLPIVFYALVADQSFGLLSAPFIGGALLLAVGGGAISWWNLRYRLDEEALVIVTGILSRQVRRIPYRRIHNVAAKQGPLHRAFGMADARIETASGGGAEADLSVVSLDELERLRERIYAGRQADVDEDAGETEREGGRDPSERGLDRPIATREPARELVQVSLPELALYGITRNRSGKILAAGLGLFWEFGQFGDSWLGPLRRIWPGFDPEWLEGDFDPGSLGSDLSAWLSPGRLLVAIGTVLVLLLLLNIVSVVWAVLQLQGFRLTRQGDDLRIAYGLLTRHTATIPRHRIQSLALQQSWLFRRYDKFSISAETAGSDVASQSVARQLWLSPISSIEARAALVEEAQPDLEDPARVEWRPVAEGASRRILRRRLLVAAPFFLLAAALPFVPSAALLLYLPYALWAWWEGRRQADALAWALDDRALWLRHGWWNQTVVVVRPAKIQNLRLVESPFDRRAGMVGLHVDTAGQQDPSHRLRMPYLPRVEAEALRDQLHERVADTRFRW